jgi:hypothetical protein
MSAIQCNCRHFIHAPRGPLTHAGWRDDAGFACLDCGRTFNRHGRSADKQVSPNILPSTSRERYQYVYKHEGD